MKPYRTITIRDCHEPMYQIPDGIVALTKPHPYMALGAPYGAASPWMLRKGVLQALLAAQSQLSEVKSGWKIKLFDAFRPLSVQEFMVEREFALLAQADGLDPQSLSPEQRESLLPRVLRVWAIPDHNPLHPPPHSTGAALDLTLQDEFGRELDMGSPIDENSDRSLPDYYAAAKSAPEHAFHEHRCILNQVMITQGFARHPAEWWHFSLGDQMWAYANKKPDHNNTVIARYGRADLLTIN